MAVRHAQFRSTLIHLVRKGPFAASQMLGHGAGAVVGGGHGDGFHHVRHGHLLPGLQIDLASALGRRRFRGGNDVVPADLSAVDGLHDEQQGHDFRDAGRRQGLVGILFKEYRAGGNVQQHSAFGPFPQLRRLNFWA